MSDAIVDASAVWFYEEKGQRKGPISESQIAQLIKASVISRETPVWKQGLSDWLKIENTDLRAYLDLSGPPPLSGQHINNTVVWVLAFAPIIGYLLEWFVAGAFNGGEEGAAVAMANNKY